MKHPFTRIFVTNAYVVFLAICFGSGVTVNTTSKAQGAVSISVSSTPTKISARNTGETSLPPASPTTANPKAYPSLHGNETYNCDDIKWRNGKTNHSNTSIYVYYTDSDPYICNLNPLHCKRPKQPKGGDKNSLGMYPKYGDYSYLPISQWILLLQHGAVVFLYHPCTSKENIAKLRSIAKKCMRRHIITPYEHLNYSQPIAMVAWASFYADGYVNETASKNWIRNNAMKGPASHVLLNGGYDVGLKNPARVVSDAADRTLCPKTPMQTAEQEQDIDMLDKHYKAINNNGHSTKKLKKLIIQNLKKHLKPAKRHVNTRQAAWAVGSLLFLCVILVAVLFYTKPWNERDYYLKEKMTSRNNNSDSNFSLLKSHLRRGGRSWRDIAEQQRQKAASRRLLGPIHEEEEDFMDL